MNALRRIINAIVRRETWHHRHATGTVAIGYPDGTFDVKLDDGSSVQGVAPRPGIPALALTAEQGTRCLVAWDGPDDAHIAAWESAGLRQVQLGGARGFARVGDDVDVLLPSFASVTVACVITGTVMVPAPGGAIPTPFGPMPGTGALTPSPPFLSLQPRAAIRGGHPKVTA